MAIYRARPCPRCQYYVGYRIVHGGCREVAVKSFCLNCNYQFPVRAVLRGIKTFPRAQRMTARARLSESSRRLHSSAERMTATPPLGNEMRAQRPNYARELRVIGQELEKRRFSRFNLKCSDDSYFVWSTEASAPFAPIARILFRPGDVKRLEREAVQSRQGKNGISNGRRLSHLLRTVGEQVYRRNQRLLAVAWQEPEISVVAENARGRSELNILRTDNIYDLWVRMYLQRSR
jgi:hypothetical protein